MTQTRAPAAAMLMARLAVVVVLPSPGSEEVKTIERGWLAASTNCRLVRSARNASARGPCGSDWTMSGCLELSAS